MKYKNLQRAREIAEEAPLLEKARKALANEDAVVSISHDGQTIILPPSLRMNIINVINLEMNRLREEVDGL